MNEIPTGFLFVEPVGLDNANRIYGTLWDEGFDPSVAVYANGTWSAGQHGIVTTVSGRGKIAGGVIIDPENFLLQAAIFGDDGPNAVPFRPGEISSVAFAINDRDVALVQSVDTQFNPHYFLFRKGRVTPQDDNLPDFPSFVHMNDRSQISYTDFAEPGYRGFRLDTHRDRTIQLDPLPTEPHAWAMDINDRGEVLGYSFLFSGRERIGIWDRQGSFQTYFVEGTPEFPTVSNRLHFNNQRLVVITDIRPPRADAGHSYLVPKPGLRLDLAEIVQNLPADVSLSLIYDINDRGNLLGTGSEGIFLLSRIDDDDAGEMKACTPPTSATAPTLRSTPAFATPPELSRALGRNPNKPSKSNDLSQP